MPDLAEADRDISIYSASTGDGGAKYGAMQKHVLLDDWRC